VPPWLTKITAEIHESSGLFPSAINHVLINEYHPDQGIMVRYQSSDYFVGYVFAVNAASYSSGFSFCVKFMSKF
jgi:hypothetical protein